MLASTAVYAQNETASFDFSISTNPSTGAIIPVTAGGSTTIAVGLTLLSGTPQPVTFSCRGLPGGGSCSFSPSSCNPTCSSTMTISTPSNTTPWTYTYLVIDSSGGGVQHGLWYYNLQVLAPPVSYSNCSQGPIPSSGCYCGRGNIEGPTPEFSGYCCWGSYSPTACATTIQPCTDSDGGINFNVKGTGSGNYIGATTRAYTTYEDWCATSTQLNEAFCNSDGYLGLYGHQCAYGCQNGICLNQTTTAGCSVNSDCGTPYFPSSGATFCGPVDASVHTKRMKYQIVPACVSGTCNYQRTEPGVLEDCSASGKICGFSPANGGQFQCVVQPSTTCTLNASITSACMCGPASYEQYGSCCLDAYGKPYQSSQATCPQYTPPVQPVPTQNATNVTNPCANVVCNAPPSATCDGSNVRSYYSSGTCNNGVCSYPYSTYSCPYGCSNGVCKPYTVGSGDVVPAPSPSGGGGGGGAIACPAGCECKYDGSGNVIATYCTSQPMCNYNGVCDKGEDAVACKDCIGAACPVNVQCPDGTAVTCQRTGFGCSCGTCPIPTRDVPLNCRQETDRATGFVRVICERPECSVMSEEIIRIKCSNYGGIPVFRTDPSGCQVFDCQFGGQRVQSPVFATPVMCPSPEEVSESLKKCEQSGMQGFVSFENGCKIGKCLQETRQVCGYIPDSQRKSAEDECRVSGGHFVSEFDQNGCQYLRCSSGGECQKDVPKEAYLSCSEKGGQFAVRRDNSGCVAFAQCLARGDESQSFVENVREVPDSTELLSIAFKLEDLKIQLDKLAKKTNDIADYYRSIGSSDEGRFRRVSDMFSAAKDKIDEIRTKLRNRANAITTDDILEIKQDLRYIKDVMLKDILFVMLSSNNEVEEIKNGTIKNCRTDGECFDRAFRVCQPLTFRPENGVSVEVRGLEGNACIMYVVMSQDKVPAGTGTPPYEMTCKIQNYALGVRNPNTDIFPYCTGNLVDVLKTYIIERVPSMPELEVPVPAATATVRVCISDAQCEAGFSCWKDVPSGAFAGVRGSAENPGTCYDNGVIPQIV